MVIVGFVVVLVSVIGGYAIPGGHLDVLVQPFELMIIGGAAVGAFITGNTKVILAGAGKSLGRTLKGPRHNKASYVELLSLLYQTFKLARSKGNIAIEAHIEKPEESEIFSLYPQVQADHHAMLFLCDYLRLLTMGSENPHELEALMDVDLETHHAEENAVAKAINSVADGLPALGIVAAVLGIILTMQSIDEGAATVGLKVAGALVGTFLGVFLAYGIVAPVGGAMAALSNSRDRYRHCIRHVLTASVSGVAPPMAVEIGRRSIFMTERPSFEELEEALRSAKGG